VALGLVQSLQEQIAAGGYMALGVLIAVENVFPPIPSEVVLPLAGFYVSEGTLALVPAIAAATAGSLVGAWILYALGRFGGRRLVLRFHRVLRVSEEQLDRADDWFDRYDWALVLFGRCRGWQRRLDPRRHGSDAAVAVHVDDRDRRRGVEHRADRGGAGARRELG
jgi:membrane protein DedA with SNARE-associated domain